MLKKIYNLLEPADRKKCAGLVIVVFMVSMLNFAGLASIFPLLKIVLDGNHGDFNVGLVMFGILVFIVVKNLAVFLLNRVQTKFLLQQFRHFSYQLFCRYYQRGLLFIRDKGAVRLTNDVNSLCLTFSVSVLQSILSIMGDSILAILVFAALAIMSPLASLFLLLACIPLFTFYWMVVRSKVREYGKDDLEARRKQARTVSESFRGFVELEVSNAFEIQVNRFIDGLDTINQCRLKMDAVRAFPALLCEVAIILGLSLLILVQDESQLLVGGVFALAAFRLMPSVRNILGCWTSLQQSSYCIDTLQRELEGDLENKVENKPLTFENELCAENITFAYKDSAPTLKDFSCTIAKGECVGIQGQSGAGKSTLFNVLLGFFPVQSGRVTVDGKAIDAQTVKAWHNMVGYVPQNVFILQAPLAENIALGCETIDEERVWKVLEQVQLKTWAEELPDGINTHMGEAGNRLSGGQRQRIGIARALYKQAEVLFFDEATSALDNETEREINVTLRALSELRSELTMVIIAHRDTSLAFCDRIINISEMSNTEPSI
ncbi:MAG: ABC transporter ATP-binding protein/permease [Paludibacteraceae bacterium]|nr:ABC transporter ATP-binding protein/permease [Paludibacteraceae bacterium]